jgi:hypothetical protein
MINRFMDFPIIQALSDAPDSSSANLRYIAAASLQFREAEVDTMARRWIQWQRVVAMTFAGCLGVAALGQAQFTSLSDHSRAMLEGNWQSCREADGQYAERVYDGKWPGMAPFELHMGPYHEFALFRGITDGHRSHNSPENLLKPFNIELRGHSAHQVWNVAGVHLEVTLAGGSREDCESWYVTLQRSASVSH